jgi:hypothetical protein
MRLLNRIHVLAIALIVIVGIAAAFFMGLMKPRQGKINDLTANIATEETKAAERPKVQAKLDKAREDKAAAEARWSAVMDAKMSHISLKDPHKAMFELNAESPTYAPQIISAINSDPGVRFTGSMAFGGVGWSPPSQAMQQRVFNQTISLRVKDFPTLLEWLQQTERLPRIMRLGGSITITGPSPNIDVSIPGTFYIHYRDARPAAAKTASAGGRAAGTSGTGGRRGRPISPMARMKGAE